MAKNIEHVEESIVSLSPRRSLASTECPIPFMSATAGKLAEEINEYFSIYRDLSSRPYSITGGIDDDVDGYVTIYGISGIYTVYSTAREKDILVLKASSGVRMPGTGIYECLSSKEYAGFPVYIESKDQFIPVYGIGSNGEDLFLVVSQKEYREPKQLYDGFLVRITRYYYKYNSDSIDLFTCNSFDTANKLLFQKYHEYKELGFESETIPDARSNEWLGEHNMNTVHIVIRDLIDDCPAKCPEGFA